MMVTLLRRALAPSMTAFLDVSKLWRTPFLRASIRLRAKDTAYTADEYWTRRAREEGVPARAYYKLEELDRRLELFHAGDKVLDLGCWPGSWTLYAARKIGKRGRVLGIDLKEVDFPLPDNAKTRVEDAYKFKGSNVPMLDVVISDMAPRTIGHGLRVYRDFVPMFQWDVWNTAL
eukprot:symbB.v1.2.002120.t1/scaffold106.1/size366728/8